METLATQQLDGDLAVLRANADRWARLAPAEKERLLAEMSQTVFQSAPTWVAAAVKAKGIAGTPLEGEEWISGPWAVLYALTRYRRTLREIARSGAPRLPASTVRARPDGRTVVDVYPVTMYDRLLLNGVRAEVWMQDGVTPENLQQTLGTFYQKKDPKGRVTLVLGAGNIASIPPLDILYALVADGAVCMLKMNPVNDYLAEIFEAALAPLIREGYLRIAKGGSDVGTYLCGNEQIDAIHITGSGRTHDAIVFGAGPEGEERKRNNEPLLRKPIASELGNVSPTIVVPGPWSDADYKFQAENIVTQKLHNAGFNCIASQVLILPDDWEGTPRLLDEIGALLRRLPRRPQYYPGADERHAALAGDRKTQDAAATLLSIDPNDPNEVMLSTEAFSNVLAVARIPGSTETYLDAAVRFANDGLWGTLGGNLIVHPRTERDYRAAVDRAIADLRFGCVAVNVWSGAGYFICETPWGAYPGHSLDDVGSGIGVVHNAHLFSRSLKSVVRGPFAPFPRSIAGYGGALLPKPPWFVTHKSAAQAGEALCAYEVAPSPLSVARVAFHAMNA